LRKFLRNILLTANIALALTLILTYISVNISPARWWIFAFIALNYPLILLLNLMFVVCWSILKKWYLLISLICIAIGWNTLQQYVQLNFKKPQPAPSEKTLSVLTYNVRLFNYYQWNYDTSAWQKIAEYVHSKDPDVVCFQEFITVPGTHHDLNALKKKLAPLSYSHVFYTDHVGERLNFGMAIFSKYPIVYKENIEFKNSLNGSMCSDIVVDKDTFRIYNCHLQSIGLRNDYSSLLDSLIFNYSEKQLNELKDISLRMRRAYIQRAKQVDKLAAHIKTSPYPVVVCGDFNDIPTSYTYHKLSKGLRDAFIESGSGIGNTFRVILPYVRIDYVLYSSSFEAKSYGTQKMRWSDHYPVTTRFTIIEKADSSDRSM
jgi:endonuclease/exonuclease/phosphatase family metal-dependent hydrolase